MIDGHQCPPSDQKISVFDRGFLYGDSVFETVRTYAGAPFALDEHLGRLERSAQLVYIELPVSLRQLGDEVFRALSLAGHPESYVRIVITRGQGALGLDPALSTAPCRVLIVGVLTPPPDEWYSEGVSVISYRTQRQIDSTSAEGAKVGNYLVSVLAMRAARERSAVEALIVDGRGRALEGGSSNVFLVRAGRIVTPPEEAGILPGITRAHVMALARTLGLDVELRTPDLSELYAADEVFITSSVRELVPVVRVDDRTIGDGRPGPVATILLQRFRALTRRQSS